MSRLLILRTVVTTCIINLLTYILPIIDSIKIIHNNDMSPYQKVENMKKYLKFWCITIVSKYVEKLCLYLYVVFYFKTTIPEIPAELRILFLLFLTYGDGIEYLYKSFVAPLFLEHEEFIDQTINYILQKAQTALIKHIQNIIWQILYNPNDGLITSNIHYLSSLFFKYTILFNARMSSSSLSDSNSLENKEQKDTVTSQNLGKLLLLEFRNLMIDGIFVEAFSSNHTKSSSSTIITNLSTSNETFQPVKLSLTRKGFSISIESFIHQSTHHNSTGNVTSLCDDSLQDHKSILKIQFPVVCITDVSEYHTRTKPSTNSNLLHNSTPIDIHISKSPILSELQTLSDRIVIIEYIDPTIILPVSTVLSQSIEQTISTDKKSKYYKSTANRFNSFFSTSNNNSITSKMTTRSKNVLEKISKINNLSSTTATTSNMNFYHPIQYILLLSEDHDESLSLLTGLQILATSTRGTFVKKLSHMTVCLSRLKLKEGFSRWKNYSDDAFVQNLTHNTIKKSTKK